MGGFRTCVSASSLSRSSSESGGQVAADDIVRVVLQARWDAQRTSGEDAEELGAEAGPTTVISLQERRLQLSTIAFQRFLTLDSRIIPISRTRDRTQMPNSRTRRSHPNDVKFVRFPLFARQFQGRGLVALAWHDGRQSRQTNTFRCAALSSSPHLSPATSTDTYSGLWYVCFLCLNFKVANGTTLTLLHSAG